MYWLLKLEALIAVHSVPSIYRYMRMNLNQKALVSYEDYSGFESYDPLFK